MFKNYGFLVCVCITKWTDLTSNLEIQWPLRGMLNFPKLVLLKIKLESHGSKTTQNLNGMPISNGTLRLPAVLRVLSLLLQNTVSKFTEVNNWKESSGFWWLTTLSHFLCLQTGGSHLVLRFVPPTAIFLSLPNFAFTVSPLAPLLNLWNLPF